MRSGLFSLGTTKIIEAFPSQWIKSTVGESSMSFWVTNIFLFFSYAPQTRGVVHAHIPKIALPRSPGHTWAVSSMSQLRSGRGDRFKWILWHWCYVHTFKNNAPLQWRHNEHDGVSNHQPHDCLLNRLFRRRSKKTSNLRDTGLCAGNSPGTGEFPA